MAAIMATNSTQANRGRKFQTWKGLKPIEQKQSVPIGCGAAPCALPQQSLDSLSRSISSHSICTNVTWAHLNSSQLITTVLTPSHVTWAFSSSHLIWTLLVSAPLSLSASPFYAARLNSALLSSSPPSHVRSSQLIPCHLTSGYLTSSRIVSSLLNSASALRSSCQQMSCLLISTPLSSQLFWVVLTSSQFISPPLSLSPRVSSSHLISALLSSLSLSDHLRSSLAQKTCSKTEAQRQGPKSTILKFKKKEYERLQKQEKSAKTHCRNLGAIEQQLPLVKTKLLKTKLLRETSLTNWKLRLWKRSFCARPHSQTESWGCENEAFVRGIPQKLKVELVKTKLSCETSLKNWKLRLWERGFRTRHPSKTESWSFENEPFIRDILQNYNSLKLRKWSLNRQFQCVADSEWSEQSRDRLAPVARQTFPIHFPRRVFCCKTHDFARLLPLKSAFSARLPSNSASWSCENEVFVRDIPQKLQVEALKTKLSCETSLKNYKLKILAHPAHLSSSQLISAHLSASQRISAHLSSLSASQLTLSWEKNQKNNLRNQKKKLKS